MIMTGPNISGYLLINIGYKSRMFNCILGMINIVVGDDYISWFGVAEIFIKLRVDLFDEIAGVGLCVASDVRAWLGDDVLLVQGNDLLWWIWVNEWVYVLVLLLVVGVVIDNSCHSIGMLMKG